MRKLIMLSVVVLIAACSDNQPPTSPVNGSGNHVSATPQLNQAPEANGKPLPGPIAFTTITRYHSPTLHIPPGDMNNVTVACPTGSVMTGGGYDLGFTFGATYPLIYQNAPTPTGWVAGVNNQQPGSSDVFLEAWVLCAS
jgi:hypothetical protein